MPNIKWNEIKETLRLEEALDELGIDTSAPRTRKGWSNISCPLPSHPGTDRTPSFGYNADDMVWKCFTCIESGSIPRLVSLVRGDTYEEALEFLIQYADIDQEVDENNDHVREIDRIYDQDRSVQRRKRDLVLPFFSPSTIESLELAPLEILSKWNIQHEETIEQFGIRYDSERFRLGYSGPALVIPHWFKGELVGWQERWLDFGAPGFPENIAKYTNSGDFPRQETLFAYDRAILRIAPILVVESVMTVMRLWELGYAAVSTFGGAISPLQLRLLANIDHIVLAFDNDETGWAATIMCAEYLTDYTEVSAVPFPDGQKYDLADLEEEKTHDLIGGARSVLEII